jgi:hypothetical protein
MLPHTARDYLNARLAPPSMLERAWGLDEEDYDKRLVWLVKWQSLLAQSAARSAEDALDLLRETYGLPH